VVNGHCLLLSRIRQRALNRCPFIHGAGERVRKSLFVGSVVWLSVRGSG
jgi:hypothetical protein